MTFLKKNLTSILFALALVFSISIICTVRIAVVRVLNRTTGDIVNDHGLVVGFVELVSESEWRDRATESVKEAARNHNVQLFVVKSDRTLEGQIEAVRALIAYRVDVLIFSPVSVTGWDHVLLEAKTAGIPAILSDRTLKTDVDGAIYSFVGSSCVTQGERAATYIKEYYADTDRVINIVECIGTVGASSSVERSRGIRNVFNNDKKYDIYYQVSADGLMSKSRELFDNFFRNNQDTRKTDVFIGYSDTMACGAIEAMARNDLMPGEDILVVSIGGTQPALDLLAAGKINCVIEDNYNLGEDLILTAIHIYHGDPVEAEIYLDDAIYYADTTGKGRDLLENESTSAHET